MNAFSKIFEKAEVKIIGLQLSGSSGFPFLENGVTQVFWGSSGKFPSVMNWLMRQHSSSASAASAPFIAQADIFERYSGLLVHFLHCTVKMSPVLIFNKNSERYFFSAASIKCWNAFLCRKIFFLVFDFSIIDLWTVIVAKWSVFKL